MVERFNNRLDLTVAFDIGAFVLACRDARKATDWPEAVAALLRQTIADPDRIRSEIAARGYSAKHGYDVFLHSPDLTVYNVTAKRGHLGPPHDHATTAVVGTYEGVEGFRVYNWDGVRLKEVGRAQSRAPDVSILPAGLIHALDNSETAGSSAIHVYGNSHFDCAERRLWNPHTFELVPFNVQTQRSFAKGTC